MAGVPDTTAQAQALLHWMEHDLGIEFQKLPSTDAVKVMLSDQNQTDFWSGLKKHLCSYRSAHQSLLMKHLKECDNQADPNVETLICQRNELVKLVADVRASLSYADKELHSIDSRLKTKTALHQAVKQQCDEKRLRSTLLGAHSSKLGSQIANLRACKELCSTHLKNAGGGMFAEQNSSPCTDSGDIPQSEIQLFLEKMLTQETIENKGNVGRWPQETLHSEINTPSLLIALSEMIERDRSWIQSQFSGGGEQDAGVEQANSQISQFLAKAHKDHVGGFEEVEDLRYEAKLLRSRVESIISDLDKKQILVEEDAGKRKIRAMGWKQDRDLAGAKAGISAVSSRIEHVKSKLFESNQIVRRLRDKQSNSDESMTAVEESKLRLTGIMSSMCKNREAISKKQSELLAFCENEVIGRGAALAEACKAAKTSLTQAASCADQPTSASLPSTEGMAQSRVKQEVDGSSGTVHQSFESAVLSAVRAPSHLAADCVVLSACQARQRLRSISGDVAMAQKVLKQLQSQPSFRRSFNDESLQRTRSAMQEWEKRWRAQVDKELVPCIKTCRDAAERSNKVEELIQDWQQQPGQYAVPWVKVQGKELSDWIDALSQAAPREMRTLPS